MSQQAPSGMQSTNGSQGELADRTGQAGLGGRNEVQAVQKSAEYGGSSDTGRATFPEGQSASPGGV